MCHKTKSFFISLIFFTLFSSGIAEAGLYLSGSTGTRTTIDRSANYHGLYNVALGYSLPILLKVEAFYQKDFYHLVGLKGRFSPLSFLSLTGGIVRRFTPSRYAEKDGNGFIVGPGINFWLIPIVDIFADLNYLHISDDDSVEGQLGVRVHF